VDRQKWSQKRLVEVEPDVPACVILIDKHTARERHGLS
jgi:hypothetical protein